MTKTNRLMLSGGDAVYSANHFFFCGATAKLGPRPPNCWSL